MSDCPFCHLPVERVVLEDEYSQAFFDDFPISPGHLLIIPKVHVTTLFDLNAVELASMMDILRLAREILIDQFDPDGFNIGINDGEAAGQTISHLHLHLIPRYEGDVADPRGGIRWLIPAKAKYCKDPEPVNIYCPHCINFNRECNVDPEDYELPCSAFKVGS